MTVVGVKCKYRGNVSLVDCATCTGCCAHGGEYEDFPAIIRKKLLFNSSNGSDKPGDIIYVTKIIGCLRRHYFSLTEDTYMDPSGFISTGLGSAFHEYLGKDIWDMREKKLYWKTPNGNTVLGMYDRINISNRVLYDIKTITWSSYIKEENCARINDTVQLQVYATILKVKYGVDLSGIKVTYIGTGDKQCCEFPVPYIDRTEYINTSADSLLEAIKNKIPPQPTPNAVDCAYCQWPCTDMVKVKEKVE